MHLYLRILENFRAFLSIFAGNCLHFPASCTGNEKVEKSFTIYHLYTLEFKIARPEVITVGGNQIINIVINLRLKTYKVMIKVPRRYISYSYKAIGTYINVCLSAVFFYTLNWACLKRGEGYLGISEEGGTVPAPSPI